MKRQVIYGIGMLACILFACNGKKNHTKIENPNTSLLANAGNIINYTGFPENKKDRSMLMFSDQGAWFGYSIPDSTSAFFGFSGPFLLTQDNGVWSSKMLTSFNLIGADKELVNWKKGKRTKNAYPSHLEQFYENDSLEVTASLVFSSGHTALQQITVKNTSQKAILIQPRFSGVLFNNGTKLEEKNGYIHLTSSKTLAEGYLGFPDFESLIVKDSLSYEVYGRQISLRPQEQKKIKISHTFIFPEYSWKDEKLTIVQNDVEAVLQSRKLEKERQLQKLKESIKPQFGDESFFLVQAKALLTMQNNWRIPAGELKHQGLFPSYHYEWFQGFWSWDSWKHAVGLSYYNIPLAKDQMRAMFEFQLKDGFIVDCIYRDTTIERHNYRDTKPPLAAWAVLKIFEKDKDTAFVKEMYPKLKKYHQWWYTKRDHDQDGVCEYGSTDGTVIAAKWESGMDNAIRFDDTKMLKNMDGAYSMDQESVDLNAYLYAEKLFLSTLASVVSNKEETIGFKQQAQELGDNIRKQFFNSQAGWFNDTSIDGKTFIEGAGSEGWIPLWAGVASNEQAESIKNKMMDSDKFYTTVPFQTMAKDHPKFNPKNGYWRGPNWLDQAYFGVKGLRNYGYHTEADKATIQILKGAQGIMDTGSAIRENYHPITGEGLYAQNFSWSAAHLIMMLSDN